jgi:hypothetical protein
MVGGYVRSWVDDINSRIDHVDGYRPGQKTLCAMVIPGNIKGILTLVRALFTLGALFYFLHHHTPLPWVLHTPFTYIFGDPCCLPAPG